MHCSSTGTSLRKEMTNSKLGCVNGQEAVSVAKDR